MKIKNKNYYLVMMAAIAFLISGCGSGGSSGGTGVTSTVGTPAEMNVGDILVVDISDNQASLDFEGVVSSAKFIFISGTTDTSTGSYFNISSDIASNLESSVGIKANEDGESGDDYGPDEILSAWLRASEEVLAYSEPVPNQNLGLSVGKSLSYSERVMVGDVRSFEVISSVYDVDSYITVEAEARCVGQEIAFFVDTRVRDSDFSDEEIQEQCESFDGVAAEEMDILGETSDVNDDGLVTVLITPQINMLGNRAGGLVAGYFYAADLYNGQNHQEIVFALAPDPDGRYGARISKFYYNEFLLPAVLPHELQHAINYNQHVFVNGGSPEEAWLNEGVSHLVEDVFGFGYGNATRYSLFLADPSNTSLVTSGSPDLRQRGAIYLFLRFLYEQSADGNAFLRKLVDTNKKGIDNLENAFNGSNPRFDQFSEFMGRWSVALVMTDRGISSDPRYTYHAQTIDANTGNRKGVRISGDANNGRGTILQGVHLNDLSTSANTVLAASSAKYFGLETVPSWMDIDAGNTDDYAILIRTE